MTTTENIVFRYDPRHSPAIRYHCVASSCSGAAATLDEARSSYRAQLSSLLQVDRRGLPAVVEHVEARVHGMWVREEVGTVHRDHGADRMLLQALLARGAGHDDFRADLDRAAARGGEPVVVLVEPDQTVGAVLDQMTLGDTLVVVYSDPAAVLGWAVVHGPEAGGAGEVPWTPAGGELRRTPIATLAATLRGGRAVRMEDTALGRAS